MKTKKNSLFRSLKITAFSSSQKLVLSALLFMAVHLGHSQERATDAYVWLQYKGKVELAANWSLALDFQHRRLGFLANASQHVLRPGLVRHLKNNVNLTLGLASFWHNINDENPIYRPEVRPYTFLEWKQPLGKAMISHRSRFELRYNKKTQGTDIIDGYNFNYRAGHKLGIAIPIRLFSLTGVSLEIYDEVLVNFGKRISVNHLDQNRMYMGLKRKINEKFSFKLGYMYIFLPTSSATRIAEQHIMVLGLGHNW